MALMTGYLEELDLLEMMLELFVLAWTDVVWNLVAC